MILEHGAMNEEMEKLEVRTILQKLILNRNQIVKQNAKEALMLLDGEEEGSESD